MNASGEGTTKGGQGEEEETSEGKDNQQTVNDLGGADHKEFKAQVHFMLLEHDLKKKMMPAPQELLKEYVKSQNFTSGRRRRRHLPIIAMATLERL